MVSMDVGIMEADVSAIEHHVTMENATTGRIVGTHPTLQFQQSRMLIHTSDRIVVGAAGLRCAQLELEASVGGESTTTAWTTMDTK